MPRVPFSSVFRIIAGGNIEPTQALKVGGLTLAPGTILSPGQVIAGIDFTQYTDADFEIDVKGEYLVITGIYVKK